VDGGSHDPFLRCKDQATEGFYGKEALPFQVRYSRGMINNLVRLNINNGMMA